VQFHDQVILNLLNDSPDYRPDSCRLIPGGEGPFVFWVQHGHVGWWIRMRQSYCRNLTRASSWTRAGPGWLFQR